MGVRDSSGCVGEGLNKCWKVDSLSVRQADRDEGQMDFILRRVMVHVCLCSEVRKSMSMMMARWAEMGRSEPER